MMRAMNAGAPLPVFQGTSKTEPVVRNYSCNEGETMNNYTKLARHDYRGYVLNMKL